MTEFPTPNNAWDLTGQVALVIGTTSGLPNDLFQQWNPRSCESACKLRADSKFSATRPCWSIGIGGIAMTP